MVLTTEAPESAETKLFMKQADLSILNDEKKTFF